MTDTHSFRSRRSMCYARRGMVCSSQPLAAQAGLEMLKKGGNAVDAAVAAAAAHTVLEPTSNGLGSDAFALVWHGGRLYGLNGSGPAPAAMSIAGMRGRGYGSMPERGWLSVDVPGAPGAWAELSRRFGRLPFDELLRPAAAYAREGYPVSPIVARLWQQQAEQFGRELRGAEFAEWFRVFTPGGRAPLEGEVWACPEMGDTLDALAESRCEEFYRGALARKTASCVAEHGGALSEDDLAAYRPEWVEPVSVSYRGHEIWELPPNGHGLVVLMALGLLAQDEPAGWSDAGAVHRRIEAMKLAFADGMEYITDPRFMDVSPRELLDGDYLAARRALIGPRAALPRAGDPRCGGTVYLCTADGEGSMVSFIQSNYRNFGSGIVVPGTGISLNDRAFSFSLDEKHHNALRGGKRPYHTIIPGFITRGGEAVGPFGVMGEYMQPQGQLQAVVNMLDGGMDAQAALDTPRWQWVGGMDIEVEPAFPESLASELAACGHNVIRAKDFLRFGRGQIILRSPDGVLAAGTEPRADGFPAAW